MLEFTPGITLNELNPYSQRLGNDYLDNLLEIGIVLLPEVYKEFPDYTIERCFTPKIRLEDEGIIVNWVYRKFTRALGMSFRVKEWNSLKGINFCKNMNKEYNRKNHYIIDSDKETITILIKMKTPSIIEIFNGNKRELL